MQVQTFMDDSPAGLLVARLTGCHQNSLEAFSYFSASIAVGIASKVDKIFLNELAYIFLVIRLAYTLNYCFGCSVVLRPLLWFAGVCICITILVAASKEIQ
jgi:uncharacterized MAPEG superfamily protein